MKTKPIKNKIMVVTTAVFAILTLFFNMYIYSMKTIEQEKAYLDKEKNLKNVVKHLENTLTHTVSSRLETLTQLDYFQDFKHDLAQGVFTHRALHLDRLRFHFENIQKQIPSLDTLHIIDKFGYSYIRLHETDHYKDKISDLRSSILDSLKNPRIKSFYEYGSYGLKYRISQPIYLKEELVGLLEIGLDPFRFVPTITELSSFETFIFLKDKDQNLYTAHSQGDHELSTLLQNDDATALKYENKNYLKYTLNLHDVDNRASVKIVAIEDITESKRLLLNFFLISLLTTIVLMFLLLWLLDRFFTKILQRTDELLYLINNTQDFIIAVDASSKRIKFANAPLLKLLGISRQDLKLLLVDNILVPIPEDARQGHKLFEERSNKALTKRGFLACGINEVIPLEMSINYIQKDGGYFVVMAKDISGNLELELQKKVNERVINKYIPMSHTDLNGVITYVNEAFCTLTGYTQEELLGENHSIIKSPKTPQELYKNLWNTILADQTFRSELRVLTKEKEEIWVKILIEPRYDINGKKIGYISTREDVTDKQKLKFISEHDQLTKAYNRRSFESKLEQMLEDARKHAKAFGLIMFDIDHFKKVNDTYGHQAGDAVLVTMSKLVKETLREEDFFARWGGEEFMLIVKNTKVAELERIVVKLQEHLKTADFAPVPKITSSFGITLYKNEDTKENILKRVDEALYRAKELGRDRYEIG